MNRQRIIALFGVGILISHLLPSSAWGEFSANTRRGFIASSVCIAGLVALGGTLLGTNVSAREPGPPWTGILLSGSGENRLGLHRIENAFYRYLRSLGVSHRTAIFLKDQLKKQHWQIIKERSLVLDGRRPEFFLTLTFKAKINSHTTVEVKPSYRVWGWWDWERDLAGANRGGIEVVSLHKGRPVMPVRVWPATPEG